MVNKTELIATFEAEHRAYGNLCARLEMLLGQLIHERRIPVHSISSRLKGRDSFIRKIEKKGSGYARITDVTDLAGVRIITYFADQVDEIARVVESEFDVDRDNSIDKRSSLDPDRFGYLSLHYVVALSAPRAALPEYRGIAGLKAEIQIRSILQHAWAEIEHDFGYKTTTELPRPVRRQFARLAGLLELADSEFVSIRTALDEYSRDVGARIAEEPAAVTLDKISLLDFVRGNPLVVRLDSAVSEAFRHSVRKNEESVAGDVEKLQHFRLQTIADVERELRKYADPIVQLAHRWANEEDAPAPGGSMPEGISLFYLCHVMAGASQDIERVLRYLETCRVGGDESPEETAEDLIQFMKSQGR